MIGGVGFFIRNSGYGLFIISHKLVICDSYNPEYPTGFLWGAISFISLNKCGFIVQVLHVTEEVVSKYHYILVVKIVMLDNCNNGEVIGGQVIPLVLVTDLIFISYVHSILI